MNNRLTNQTLTQFQKAREVAKRILEGNSAGKTRNEQVKDLMVFRMNLGPVKEFYPDDMAIERYIETPRIFEFVRGPLTAKQKEVLLGHELELYEMAREVVTLSRATRKENMAFIDSALEWMDKHEPRLREMDEWAASQ